MLYTIFQEVLHMSMAASLVILIVFLLRLLLHRFPKIFSYALWGIVLIRLLLPFSFEVSYRAVSSEIVQEFEFLEDNEVVEAEKVTQVDFIEPQVEQSYTLERIYPHIWILGMISFGIYHVISYARLRYRLVGAIPYDEDEDIYFADEIEVPFVIGAMNPKIYMPSTLIQQELEYIIQHEMCHIRRKDHIIKPIAILALCIHWFNPLVWFAFFISSKDMEMSCDEAVLKRLNENQKADYCASLLQLATGRKLFSGVTIAFGEGDTKSRIQNVLKWSKPKFIKVMIAFVLTIAVIVTCAFVPKNKTITHPYKWIEQADFQNMTCDYVDDITIRDLAYILKQLNVTDFDTYTEYTSEIELLIRENGEEVRLIYGDGVTLFSFENNISSGKLWGVKDKDLAYCMKEIRANRAENIAMENYVEPWKPSKEDVHAMQEKVLVGINEENLLYITELIKVMNLELEYDYIYGNMFESYEDPKSTEWNYFTLRSIVYQDVGEDYIQEPSTIETYRQYLSGVEKRLQTNYLKDDIAEMFACLDLMEAEHDINALRQLYYKLHDMDYFLFRYWADDVSGYIIDRSTISKYYGALHIYDGI